MSLLCFNCHGILEYFCWELWQWRMEGGKWKWLEGSDEEGQCPLGGACGENECGRKCHS